MTTKRTAAFVRIIATLCLSLPMARGAVAQEQEPPRAIPKPADWSQNEWYNFVESAVQISLGEAQGVAGGVFPMLDLYSALNAVGGSTKTALIFWLQGKMRAAILADDLARQRRYGAFLSCLTQTGEGGCNELRQLEREVKVRAVALRGKSDDRGNGLCDDLTGAWTQSAAAIGTSTWHITRSGSELKAVESGLGGARGFATFGGGTLSIYWRTPNDAFIGKYVWDLDAGCTGGSGDLIFDKRPDSGPRQVKSTVRRKQ
jgi:hypothetical protein